MTHETHFDATGRPTAELQSWLAHCRAFGLPAIVVAHPPGRMRIAVDGVEVFNGDPARGREVLAELEAQPRRVEARNDDE